MIKEDKSIMCNSNRAILIRDTVLQLMYLNLECGECFGHREVQMAQVLPPLQRSGDWSFDRPQAETGL